VALLMQLFQVALANEVDKLHRNGVRLKVVGDTERFDPAIRRLIEQGERLTAENRRLTLTVAATTAAAGTFCRRCRGCWRSVPRRLIGRSTSRRWRPTWR